MPPRPRNERTYVRAHACRHAHVCTYGFSFGTSWGAFSVSQRLALGELVDPGPMSAANGRYYACYGLPYTWLPPTVMQPGPYCPFCNLHPAFGPVVPHETLFPHETQLAEAAARLCGVPPFTGGPDAFAGVRDGATAPGSPAAPPGPPGLPPPQLSGRGGKGNQPAAAAEAAEAAHAISQQLPSSGGKGGKGDQPGDGRPMQAPLIERRLAPDQRGYTWREFLVYYGDEAESFWQRAPLDPTAEDDYYDILRCLEYNRRFLLAAAPDRGPNTRLGALKRRPHVPLIQDNELPGQDPVWRAQSGVRT